MRGGATQRALAFTQLAGKGLYREKQTAVLCAVAGQAAAVLWRVATDCDKAKLELTKAGAVAPAVALLHQGSADASSATQVSPPNPTPPLPALGSCMGGIISSGCLLG